MSNTKKPQAIQPLPEDEDKFTNCPHKIDWECDERKWMRTVTCKCGNTVTSPRKEVQEEIAIEAAYWALRKRQNERNPPPKKRTRVRIFKVEKEISDDVELKNGQSNPFGWSQHEVHYEGKRIGWCESGSFDLDDGYVFTEKEEIIPSPHSNDE